MVTLTSNNELKILWINGEKHFVPSECANQPLATFIKAQTSLKSVKVACGEGGCGACAVALIEDTNGRPHLRTINSCLAPVYSVLGRSILTAEGLPGPVDTRGIPDVADRLASFHASQCGYCTPGFTVACHAALHNKAASQQGASSSSSSSGGHGGRGGDDDESLRRALDGNLCRCTGYRPIVAACKSMAAEICDLEDLYGHAGANGCKSAAALPPPARSGMPKVPANGNADVEEVCLGAGQVLKVPRSLDQLVSESGWLAASAKEGQGGCKGAPTAACGGGGPGGAATADGNGCHHGPGGPTGVTWRIVAGNTGHGVFKDWPTEESVLLSLSEVPELKRLEVIATAEPNGKSANGNGNGNGHVAVQPHLHIGAGVTLERLAASLEDLAAGAAKEGSAGAISGPEQVRSGGMLQWAAESAAHLYRIAGTHVRNTATVGGNLVLAAERGLPSDVATVLGAAGAQVELLVVSADPATHGSLTSLDLVDFVSGGSAVAAGAVPAGCSYILTAVHVPVGPLADPRVSFWSQRVADRYSNAAAVANAAIMVRLSTPPPGAAAAAAASGVNDGEESAAAGFPLVEEVRVVVGVRTPPPPPNSGGSHRASGSGSNGDGSVHQQQQQQQQQQPSQQRLAKLTDPSALELDGWVCVRARAAEAALRGKPATAGNVVVALEALATQDLAAARDLAAAAVVAGGRRGAGAMGTEAAPVAIAEGLVAQGLLACTGLARERCPADTAAARNPDGSSGALNESAAAEGPDGPQKSAVGGDDGAGEVAPAGPHLPARLPAPPLVTGRQSLPAAVQPLAPVTQPTTKLGAKLQASGTALYTEDVPVHTHALYGAFVLAAQAGATLTRLDPAAALAMPGVARFLCAADLAAIGARNYSDPHLLPNLREPLFVELGGRCEYAGQVLGVVLADSPWRAQQAAKAVHVTYGSDPDGKGPVFTIAEAVRAGAFYPLPKIVPFYPAGPSYGGAGFVARGSKDVDEALRAAGAPPAVQVAAIAFGKDAQATARGEGATVSNGGVDKDSTEAEEADASVAAPGDVAAAAAAAEEPRVVVSGRYSIPSQLHFYMETQSAVAWPDEDGSVVVHSSCQGTDNIQAGVATALGLPYNKVQARCRRVGGGFGGKVSLARRVAALTAVAAVATGRQVRIKVPRNTDAAMNGGRCDTDVTYVAVLDPPGPSGPTHGSTSAAPRIRALDIHAVMQGGGYVDLSFTDPLGMLLAVDSVYKIEAFRAEAALVRCNLPPRTAVRGPGEIQGTMIIEQIMEHIAAEVGVDPEALRQANFLRLPPPPQPPRVSEPSSEPASAGQDAVGPPGGTEQRAGTPPAAPVAQASPPAAAAIEVKTTTGKVIPARLFNLQHIWDNLRSEADWEKLKAGVEAFNASNLWRKRGLAMIPTRYMMMRGRKPAFVSVLADGTVQVATHGIEMGQGLFTKVAQVAALTLAEALPTSRRPLDMGLIKVAENSTELLPNSGLTAGSTTSEMACAAVRLACLQIVENLKKHALPKLGGREDYSWQELIGAVATRGFVLGPLSAFAWGGQADLPESSGPDSPGPVGPDYHVLGVALAIVEVDVLTGERRVLRSDILFDLGRPVNPAVDLGQVEGAFVQGLGMMLQEAATYDGATGALLQTSTWNYKPPAATCVPHQLNVHILNDAPLASGGPVSSKACGEPPLLLSYVVLAALQRAVNEARKTAAAALVDTPAAAAPTADGGAGVSDEGSSAVAPAPAAAAAVGSFEPLLAPATVERVRLACGDWSAAHLLKVHCGAT